MTTTYKYKDIEYALKKSNRKTSSIYIERDGSISMLVPNQLSHSEIENILSIKNLVKVKNNIPKYFLSSFNVKSLEHAEKELNSIPRCLLIDKNSILIIHIIKYIIMEIQKS